MLDANVLVSGAIWPRFPFEVVRHAVAGDYQLVLSERIVEEARDAIAEIAPARLEHFEVLLRVSHYESVPTPGGQQIEANADLVRDPKDVHVALAAIGAQVDYLVTRDKDFTDEDESTALVRQRLNIILPGTFLREVMGWTSEELEAIRGRNWADMPPPAGE